jgi:hypothetical protein
MVEDRYHAHQSSTAKGRFYSSQQRLSEGYADQLQPMLQPLALILLMRATVKRRPLQFHVSPTPGCHRQPPRHLVNFASYSEATTIITNVSPAPTTSRLQLPSSGAVLIATTSATSCVVPAPLPDLHDVTSVTHRPKGCLLK